MSRSAFASGLLSRLHPANSAARCRPIVGTDAIYVNHRYAEATELATVHPDSVSGRLGVRGIGPARRLLRARKWGEWRVAGPSVLPGPRYPQPVYEHVYEPGVPFGQGKWHAALPLRTAVETLGLMSASWTPELQLHTVGNQCRLILVGVTYGNGATMQEAGHDLMARLFDLATAVHSGGYRGAADLGRPSLEVMDFLWEIGEMIRCGGDIRARVLGVPQPRSPLD